MQKRIKSLLRANIIWIASIVTITLLYLSLATIKAPNINISNLDKVYHVIAYFILTTCWLFVLKNKIITAIACFFFGIIIEILQTKFTAYRTGELLDVIANTTGIIIALLSYKQFLKKYI